MSRKHKLKKFGKLNIIRSLMPNTSIYMGWIKIIIFCLATFFVIIALARPYTPANEESKTEDEVSHGIEIMICMDVSNSMLASSTDDPKGISRLRRSKLILERLLEKLENDKVGLVVFAGSAYNQLPITSDYVSAKMYVNDLSTDMIEIQGTAIGAAIDMAINSFVPDSEFQKAIIVITDAENFEDNAIEAAKRAASAGIQVDVIGVGTSKGVGIPMGQNEWMKDYNGNVVLTAFNESLAREIAQAGEGEYFSASSNNVVNDLAAKLDDLSKTEFKRKIVIPPSNELYPLAILIALILLFIEGLLPYCKISWLSHINFFSNSLKNEKKK